VRIASLRDIFLKVFLKPKYLSQWVQVSCTVPLDEKEVHHSFMQNQMLVAETLQMLSIDSKCEAFDPHSSFTIQYIRTQVGTFYDLK
jgi:hypothetical protein